jgi:septal ring factor EnvC (AmiA/AmiB activator)
MASKGGSKKKLQEVLETPIELTEKRKETRDRVKAALAEIHVAWAEDAAVEKKRRLEKQEAATNSRNKPTSNTGSTSTTPQENSQDSTSEPTKEKSKCIDTLWQRFKDIFGKLSNIYYEMLEIDAELGNDETSRLLEYTKR